MSSLRHFTRESDRGQALVEFALTVPLLLMLLLGIVDFARAWNAYEVITDAGREATRHAVVDNGSTQAEVRTIIKSAAGRAGLVLQDTDITIAEGAGRGDPTTVTVRYGHDLKWVGWALGLVGGDRTITFNVASTMRRE